MPLVPKAVRDWVAGLAVSRYWGWRAFQFFRHVNENDLLKKSLVLVVTGGAYLGLRALLGITEHDPWQDALIAAAAFVTGVATISTPVALVSHELAVRQRMEINLNEILATEALASGEPLGALTESLLDEILEKIESDSGIEDHSLHVLTPSPIYFCANKVADSVGHAGDAQLTKTVRLLEKRADLFQQAIKKFRGPVHFITPRWGSRRFLEAMGQRCSRLHWMASNANRDAYIKLCSEVIGDLSALRRKAGRFMQVHDVMVFSRIRVLMLENVCYVQEIPANRHGVLAQVRVIHRTCTKGMHANAPNPAFQRIRSLIAAYEADLDKPD